MMIDWNTENEILFLLAMMNHKPVGVNKHFEMISIHDKFSSSMKCSIDSKEMWSKLATLYNLKALEENNLTPFPNDESEFSLPDEIFSQLIEERTKSTKSRISRKDELKEASKRERSHERDTDSDDNLTPRRQTKRAKDRDIKIETTPNLKDSSIKEKKDYGRESRRESMPISRESSKVSSTQMKRRSRL